MPRIDGGLELLCGDGACAAQLQRRVRHWVSAFSVRVIGELGEAQRLGVLGGALDNGERLEVLECHGAGGEGTNRWYAVRARGASGKTLRQLFERQGARVSRVLRIQLGALNLERSLPRGHFRALQASEIEALLAAGEDAPAARSGLL
jgi:23S rRNA pseudouridine2605 synthase